MNGSVGVLTPYVLRVGPIEGADGAVDVTLQNPIEIKLDDESPWVDNLQVDNGQRLIAADGYTWDPSNTVTLQVAITDTQALGDSITLHYWRSGGNDTNGDDTNGDGTLDVMDIVAMVDAILGGSIDECS